MKLENDAIFTLLQMGHIRASTIKAENTRELLPAAKSTMKLWFSLCTAAATKSTFPGHA